MIVWIVPRWCPVAEAVQADCSTALAKQQSANWLRDLLTKHVQLSADHREQRPAVVTSVHSSVRYTGAVYLAPICLDFEPCFADYSTVGLMRLDAGPALNSFWSSDWLTDLTVVMLQYTKNINISPQFTRYIVSPKFSSRRSILHSEAVMLVQRI